MSAPRNPDGDHPLWRQALTEAKAAVKCRLAPRGAAVPDPAQPYLVVPILGQSNAQGMGNGLDLAGLDRPDPRVHQWPMCGRSKGRAVLAADPLLHDVPAGGVGFGVTFGKHLAEATGRTVLLIPAARGDTSFAQKNGYTWDPEDLGTRVNLYRNAVLATDAVLARYPGSAVAAVLWHQGETDVPLTRAQVYRCKLDSVIDDLRERYGADVPFVLGGMVPEEMARTDRDYGPINAVHEDTPHRRSRAAFVPGPSSCVNGPNDRHYNAAGQRELGRRMWAAYRVMCADDLAAYGRR